LATIRIEDRRNVQAATLTCSDERAAVYEYCADAHTRKEIVARFDDAPWIDEVLGEFTDRELMIHLDNRYLSLALPENSYL
jgi:hypothetical protein